MKKPSSFSGDVFRPTLHLGDKPDRLPTEILLQGYTRAVDQRRPCLGGAGTELGQAEIIGAAAAFSKITVRAEGSITIVLEGIHPSVPGSRLLTALWTTTRLRPSFLAR